MAQAQLKKNVQHLPLHAQHLDYLHKNAGWGFAHYGPELSVQLEKPLLIETKDALFLSHTELGGFRLGQWVKGTCRPFPFNLSGKFTSHRAKELYEELDAGTNDFYVVAFVRTTIMNTAGFLLKPKRQLECHMAILNTPEQNSCGEVITAKGKPILFPLCALTGEN